MPLRLDIVKSQLIFFISLTFLIKEQVDACTERLAGSLRDLFFCQSDVLFPLKELMAKGKGRLQEEQVTEVFLSSRSIIYVDVFFRSSRKS